MSHRPGAASAHPSEELFRQDPGPWGWTLAAVGLAGPVVAGIVLTQRLAGELRALGLVGYPSVGHPAVGRPWVALEAPAAVSFLAAGLVGALGLWVSARPGKAPAGLLFAPGAVALGALGWGPLYRPWQGLSWLGPFLRHPELRGEAVEALFLAFASYLLFVALAVVAHRRGRRRVDPGAIAHGSARLAHRGDLEEAGLLDGPGVILGGWQEKGRRGALRRLTDDSEDHVLLLMPSGAGKTSGPVVTTLLNDLSPAFVLDPKGELWNLTAGWRAHRGHECLRFAPTSRHTRCWSPLEEIARGPGEIGELAVLAENLVSDPASARGQDHWVASARTLFVALALHALYQPERPTLSRLRDLLNRPDGSLEELLEELLAARHDPDGLRGFREPGSGRPTATHPEVARIARAFLNTPPKERGSIVSTLQRFLDLWGDEVVAAATSRLEISVRRLLEPQPATLYAVLPYGDLHRLAPLLRMMLALLTRRLTDDEVTERPRRILFVLDELASLGRVPILEKMLAFFRGYGVRALLAIQDLNQLHQLYSVHESLSGNCQIHLTAATQSTTTRRHVSSLSGEATVRFERRTLSRGGLGSPGRTAVASADVRRPLVTEGEVGTLGKDFLLLHKVGLPPILARKLRYFEDRELRARAEVPPPDLPPIPAPPGAGSAEAGEGLE